MTGSIQMLRRIDDELTYNRQQIALLRVKNAELEETRRTIMGLEEADQAAAEFRKAAHAGLVPGSSAKPLLVVRKATNGSAEKASEDAPLGYVTRGKRQGQPRLRRGRTGIPNPRKSKRNGTMSGSGKMREIILDLIKPGDDPIASNDLAEKLGLPVGEEARKPMQNALYQLRVAGALQRDEAKRYYRADDPPVTT